MIKWLKDRFLRLIRYPNYFPVDTRPYPADQNLEVALRSLARKETAEYIMEHMLHVDSVTSNAELLSNSIDSVSDVEDRLILEFGVFSGITVNHIAKCVGKHRAVHGFDSFEGLPTRWRDGFGKGVFAVNKMPNVRLNVHLIKGWFDEALPKFLETTTGLVKFIHMDCDLYSSCKTVLDLLQDRLADDCVIVFDEYFNYVGWREGEFKALQEFIAASNFSYEYIGYNRNHEQVAIRLRRSYPESD